MSARTKSEVSRLGAARSKVRAPRAAGSSNVRLNPEEVARLAYSLWEARGSPDGSPERDWFQAEAELKARAAAATK
jgi:hypothetical protein